MMMNQPFDRICRGCRRRQGEARRELGPWALLDVGSPTGICLECAMKLQWSVPLLAGIGTQGQEQAIALHTEAVMRAQGGNQ
jgi:hypothetical protein